MEELDWDAPLYWTDTGERGFVKQVWVGVDDGKEVSREVDQPDGGILKVDTLGKTSAGRQLANLTYEQLKAQARVAIKRAQAERKLRREQEQIDQLADLNPSLFGSF